MNERPLSWIDTIVLHCSDSDWGDAAVIDRWHKSRGWLGCGYHFVVLNGFRFANSKYDSLDDGAIETGRPLNHIGAHVAGHNKNSVGICLIGKHHFSSAQLYQALPEVLTQIYEDLGVEKLQIYGHHHFNENKSCPNLNVERLLGGLFPGELM